VLYSRLAMAAAITLMGMFPARAGIDPTVQGLYTMCQAREGSSDALSCVVYIAGVGDTLGLFSDTMRKSIIWRDGSGI
jgi:hypothetical protein